MNLLERLAVRVESPGREPQQVPLTNVLASHELLRHGCPVDVTEECPPLWWSQLASEEELRALAAVVQRIEAQVETLGGSLTLL